ncbi:hypothetical protein [Rummeliibacillus suwonensis]|uniref:hypothetical protein n=1 Tax=Rummeliibacillus suwonensis TaxID=1306154 RepID=UPI0028991558|nr:hypothetical protein [Rummeliibacillus suwonensis]
MNTEKCFETQLPNVERFFNNNNEIGFSVIIENLLKEKTENLVKSSYDSKQVNVATSDKGVA